MKFTMAGISSTQYPLATPTNTTTTRRLTTHVAITSLIFSQMKLRQKSVKGLLCLTSSISVIIESGLSKFLNYEQLQSV